MIGGVSLFKRKNGELKQISGSSGGSGEDSMIRLKYLNPGEGSESEQVIISLAVELLYSSNNSIRGKYTINGQSFIFTFLAQGSGISMDNLKAFEIPKIVHYTHGSSSEAMSMYDTAELISLRITTMFGMSISKEEVKAVFDKYSVSYDEFYGDIELSTTI